MDSTFSSRLQETSRLITQLDTPLFISRCESALELICQALAHKKPVLVCGNGGSASDAAHIAGELVGRFLIERKALNVIALSSNTSVITAWSNDYDYSTVFSRQVEAHAQAGGIVWGISTSGNSQNVIKAMQTAHEYGMKTLGLTGQGGGKMQPHCDVLLDVPSTETPRIQEMHLVVYHYLCEQIEARLACSH